MRGLMLVGREPAKMRPSKDLTTCGRWVLVRPGSSSVMAGLSAFVLPGRSAGVQGTVPRAPQATRLGGQAVRGQRNREPYPCCSGLSTSGVRTRGDHTREGQPAGGAGSGRRGRPAHDASPEAVVGPPRRARRVSTTAAAGDQLVVGSLGPLESRVPATSGRHDITVCGVDRAHRCAPGPTRTGDARTTQGPPSGRRTVPAGRARWCTPRRAPGGGVT